MTPNRDATYAVARHPGTAFRFDGLEYETCRTDEDDDQEPDSDFPTGMWIMHAVGDRYKWIVDPDDCEELQDEVCSCGQIGCGWHLQGEDD